MGWLFLKGTEKQMKKQILLEVMCCFHVLNMASLIRIIWNLITKR